MLQAVLGNILKEADWIISKISLDIWPDTYIKCFITSRVSCITWYERCFSIGLFYMETYEYLQNYQMKNFQ